MSVLSARTFILSPFKPQASSIYSVLEVTDRGAGDYGITVRRGAVFAARPGHLIGQTRFSGLPRSCVEFHFLLQSTSIKAAVPPPSGYGGFSGDGETTESTHLIGPLLRSGPSAIYDPTLPNIRCSLFDLIYPDLSRQCSLRWCSL